MDQDQDSPGLSSGVTLAMATGCGIAVANIYYNQPLLGILEHSFPDQARVVGFVPTATQVGYAIGLITLVPLGDRIERRTLILAQIAVLILALAAAALAPNPWALLAASALIGVTSTVAQQIIPFAADLARPGHRGATVGTVMSGLLCGILFARTLSGLVGAHFGWRMVFALAIGMAAATGVMLALLLPRVAPRATLSYGRLMGSMLALLREEPALRRATAVQTAMFASFGVFWTVLALRLEQAPFGMGADIAGLFGLVGASGVLVAPLAGRIADRRGPEAGISLGIALVGASWLAFGFWPSVVGLVVGVMLLDIGQQSALVSNQQIIFALRPEARSRLNTVMMGGMFTGSAIGSALAIASWRAGGWPMVCGLGFSLVVAALACHVLLGRARKVTAA